MVITQSLRGDGNIQGTEAQRKHSETDLFAFQARLGYSQTIHSVFNGCPMRRKRIRARRVGTLFRPRLTRLESHVMPSVFTVTNTNDNGSGSLRQAVLDANAASGADTVTFSSLFNAPQSMTLTTGEILINGQLAIVGPGSSLATISGNKANRIFNTGSSPSGTAINISGLTLTDGRPAKTTDYGGAIVAVDEALTLTNCVITGNNSGTFGFGGAVAVRNNGTLTATDCVFINNTASNSGAIDVYGPSSKTILRRCTISGNSATSNNGGGLYAMNYLLVDGCTISGNIADGNGGGMSLGGKFAAGGLTIRNSTLSGNSAFVDGGGVHLGYGTSGTLLIQNCTFTANTAKGYGGGIMGGSLITSVTISAESSIISGNTTQDVTKGFDIYTPGTAKVKNCSISSISGIKTLSNLGGNRPWGENPQLSPLSYNGGLLQTHALLPGSPCINVGTNPASLTTDGRGPGFVRAFGSPDIGAYEVQPTTKVSTLLVNDVQPQRSRVTSLTLTFDSTVVFSANPADAFQLKRQGDNATVSLIGNLNNNVVTLTFVGGPIEFGSLADGRYTLTALAAQINGGNFDGNSDGIPGDNYVLVGTPANGLFRLFGDSDGNGTVNSSDFAVFRTYFGLPGPGSIFDFNNDGQTTSDDFAEFRKRFGLMI